MKEASEKEHGFIFINYRRIDTGWSADHLAGMLERTFGEDRVFLDVEGIRAGDEFAVDLDEKLRRASVLIVMIGPGWLHVADAYGRRRIDQEDDWVRREIRTCLQKPGCRVIPVLIDDASLPDNPAALPDDIADLLGRQSVRLRQANSADDIDALMRELEKAGFRRLPDSITTQDFSDGLVIDVATRLRRIQQRENSEFVSRRELIRELDRLFNRKTFRFEPIRSCPEQRWGDRLASAYQTERLLRQYERNVQEVAEDKYDVYVEVLGAVGRYCMMMGTHLFTSDVDVDRIREHIGKPTFAAQLPPAVRFDTTPDRMPIIPAEVNDPVERARKRAVTYMNKFRQE